MTCEEFLHLLDNEAPVASGEAGAHLASCNACRRAWERAQAMRRELRAMREEPLPPFLHARLIAHLHADRTARRPWWNVAARPAWAGAALVTLLLVAVSGYRFYEWLRPTPLAAPTQVSFYQAPPAPPLAELRAAQAKPLAAPTFAPPAPQKSGVATTRERPRCAPESLAASPFAPAPPTEAMTEAGRLAGAPAQAKAAAPVAHPQGGIAGGVAAQQMDEVRVGQAPFTAESARRALALSAMAAPSAQAAKRPDASGASYAVVCELRSGDVVVGRPLLPASATPWGDAVWHVEVQRDGSVIVHDAAGREIAAAKAPLETVAASLHLSPGPYTLTHAHP